MSGGKQGKAAQRDRIGAEWAALIRACQGCDYQAQGRYCDYIGIVGHRRPCPPGPGCTVKTTGGKRKKVDYKAVGKLYAKGLPDKKIAAGAGCGVSTVVKWRQQNGLKANGLKGAKHGADHHRDGEGPPGCP